MTQPPIASIDPETPEPGGSSSAAARKTCDFCERDAFELIATRDREGEPLDTVICTHCGLVAHQSIPTEEQLDAFYRVDYRQDYHGEIKPSARRVMRAWKNGERIYRQVAPHLGANTGRLMEIGAGIGCTVKVFEQHGWDACGVDPNIGFQTYSHDRLKARVSAGNLYDLSDDTAYDVVLLVHVIEHFRSPRLALERIHQLLKPDGMLYVECPNLAAPFAPRAKMFHFAHIHNFTPWTLEWLANHCGFQTIARFGDGDRDPNLQFLFQRKEDTASTPAPIDYSSGYQRTMDAVNKHNMLTYHFRPSYLAKRIAKIMGYLNEHVHAKGHVSRIESSCRDQ